MREFGTGLEGLLAVAAERPCLICGRQPVVVTGVYIAEDDGAARLGAKPGTTRLVPYSLCDRHPLDEETETQAERLLEAFIAAGDVTIFPNGLAEHVTFFGADEGHTA